MTLRIVLGGFPGSESLDEDSEDGNGLEMFQKERAGSGEVYQKVGEEWGEASRGVTTSKVPRWGGEAGSRDKSR